MLATFELQGLHEPIIVLKPESTEERILLAAFLGYDGNILKASVDRYENGHIETVRILAEQSR